MSKEKYIRGTENDYTHIRFYYANKSKMTVNDFTYKYVYPNEKEVAVRFEYLKKIEQ